MSISLPAAELDRLNSHAAEGYPHEVVGILAGDRSSGRVATIRPLRNERSDSARNRYKVSGLVLMREEQALEAEGHDILGYYHSHPDHPAKYSDFDRDHALPNLSYVIVSVLEGETADLQSWRLRDDRSAMDAEDVTIF